MLPPSALPTPSATPARAPAGGRGGGRLSWGGRGPSGGAPPPNSKRLPPTNRRRPPAPPPAPGPTLEATLAALLDAGDAKPKRALGQNFLVDDVSLDAIAAAPGLGPGDGVLEIGPGTGNLTRRLLATGAAVTAIEKDDVLVAALGGALGVGVVDGVGGGDCTGDDPAPSPSSASAAPLLRLIHGDALRVHIPAELAALRARAGGGEGGKLVVVANLPYNITTDALRCLLPLSSPPARLDAIFLLLQEEAAVRVATARPGTSDWRATSVLARYYADPAFLLHVPASAFMPAPRVNSALVSFTLRSPAERGGEAPCAPAADERVLGSVIAAAFAQRRKKLRNALAPLFSGDADATGAALVGAGVDPDGRADAAEVRDFVRAADAAAKAKHQAAAATAAAAAAGAGV